MVAALISPWKSASEFWHHPNRLTRANRLSAERAPSRVSNRIKRIVPCITRARDPRH